LGLFCSFYNYVFYSWLSVFVWWIGPNESFNMFMFDCPLSVLEFVCWDVWMLFWIWFLFIAFPKLPLSDCYKCYYGFSCWYPLSLNGLLL
jgi:hypothetical protein